ncbi:MAG TPA: RNA polymerase sigma factor [Ktedonobacteraceae bacterium]|nr:RNA polymerase sigma factor [Ktedonobacteraceae bacterium]
MPENETAMIKGWQQGNEQDVHDLFILYHPRAVSLAIMSGLRPDEADDCVQESFVRAYEYRHQLRNPKAFPLWFHRILTRHILDFLGLRYRQEEISLESLGWIAEMWAMRREMQPDEIVVTAEDRTQLWHDIQQLAPSYRVPLILRYYGDFSLREVATLLDKPESTVRVAIHRALQKLRLAAKKERTTSSLSFIEPLPQTFHAKHK